METHTGEIIGQFEFYPDNSEEGKTSDENPEEEPQENEACEQCSICGKFPEDILILSCRHNLCLSCAAKIFQKTQTKRSKEDNSYICSICNTETPLDRSTVYELEKIIISSTPKEYSFREFQKAPPPPQISNQSLPQAEEKTFPDFGKPSYSYQKSSAEKPPKSKRPEKQLQSASKQLEEETGFSTKCINHPEEEVSYFCFTHITNCICPECIIHGIHKDCEVKTTKKAYLEIKDRIEKDKGDLNKNVFLIKSRIEELTSKKKDLATENGNLKNKISESFQQLRDAIDEKERQYLQTCDEMLDNSTKELDGRITNLDIRAGEYFQVIDEIGKNIKAKDEVKLLNFFAKNTENFEALKNQEVEPKAEELQVSAKGLLNIAPILEQIEKTKEVISLAAPISEKEEEEKFERENTSVKKPFAITSNYEDLKKKAKKPEFKTDFQNEKK